MCTQTTTRPRCDRLTRHRLTRHRLANDRGQATIVLVGVLALTALFGLGLVVLIEAMVHRAHARNAADAVALASVIDVDAAAELSDWYRSQGVQIETRQGYAYAASGPSQAASWAGASESVTGPAPVVQAIIARAEQLSGMAFLAPRLRGMRIEMAAADAAIMHGVATELGLCVVADPDLDPGWEAFEVC